MLVIPHDFVLVRFRTDQNRLKQAKALLDELTQ
jgi:hypothetical protein